MTFLPGGSSASSISWIVVTESSISWIVASVTVLSSVETNVFWDGGSRVAGVCPVEASILALRSLTGS